MKSWLVSCLFVFMLIGSACSDDDSSASGSSSLSSAASLAAASLYISEYVEGSGNNKYIELYNPTGAAIDLTGWNLKLYGNGALAPSASLALSGTIPAGQTFVIRRQPAGTWTGSANQADSGSTMNFNGNDPVGLFQGATLVDIVGTPGDSSQHIKDMTLIRKPGRTATTNWSLSDWYQHGPDTISFLGGHDPVSNTAEPSASSAAALPVSYSAGAAGHQVYISEYFQGDSSDKYIEIYNNSGAKVDLSSYRLVRIDADNATGATNLANSWCLQLAGELAANHTLVLVNGGFSSSRLTTVAAIPTVSSLDAFSTTRKFVESAAFYPKAICFFGGNDPLYLVKSDLVVDAVGTPASAVSWGEKKAFVRKSGTSGNPVWNSTDWDVVETMTPPPMSTYNAGSDQTAGWHAP